ncbi:MAG: protein kinase [Planctomycetota bacterium]
MPGEGAAATLVAVTGLPLTEYLRHAPLRYAEPCGFVLGPYVVERELGRGAMGVVFQARHSLLQREVALKVLLVGTAADDTQRKRFLREAQAGGAVQHPNVVMTLDAGEDQGLLYLAQEYVEGASLRARLAAAVRPGAGEVLSVEGPGEELEWPRAVELCYQVASGLGAAHARGLVHRDVKPDNVMIERATGRARLTDFGLVRDQVSDSSLTKTGAAVGTIAYMAPEQLKGAKEVGPTADVFAVGCILYEALTGLRAFGEGGAIQRLAMIHTQRLDPPSSISPQVPKELDAIVFQAVAARPEKRYPDGAALAAALLPFLPEPPPERRGSSGSGVAPPQARQGVPSWLLALLGLGAGVGIAFAAMHLARQPADAAPSPEPTASEEAEAEPSASASVTTPSSNPSAPAPTSADELAKIEDPKARLSRARALLKQDPQDAAARAVEQDLRPWRRVKLPRKAKNPGRRDGLRQAFVHVPGRGALAFGGWDGKEGFSDLWLFDGKAWTELPAVVKPPPRFAHAAAWDGIKGRLVVYGGCRMDQPGKLSFTWVWDGQGWALPPTQRQPSGRAWHCMATDPQQGVIYLYGGHDGERELDDLWCFDGSEWSEVETKKRPHARSSACLVWDPARAGLVLFGGHAGKGVRDDLWLFKGKEWRRLDPKGERPAAREAAALVATPAGLLLFGGGALQKKKHTDLDDTWLLEGERWRQLHPLSAPSARMWTAMTYDADRERVVLYSGLAGGSKPARQSDVWEYPIE